MFKRTLETDYDLFFIHCCAFCNCVPMTLCSFTFAAVSGYFMISKMPESTDLNTAEVATIWGICVLYPALIIGCICYFIAIMGCISAFGCVLRSSCCDFFKQAPEHNSPSERTSTALLSFNE